jgi:hypothetical protein
MVMPKGGLYILRRVVDHTELLRNANLIDNPECFKHCKGALCSVELRLGLTQSARAVACTALVGSPHFLLAAPACFLCPPECVQVCGRT